MKLKIEVIYTKYLHHTFEVEVDETDEVVARARAEEKVIEEHAANFDWNNASSGDSHFDVETTEVVE